MRTAVNLTLRPATIDDAEGLVELGWRFVKFTPYGGLLESDRWGFAASLARLLGGGGVCFAVVDEEQNIYGAIIGQLAPVWCAPATTMAVELGWWVDEELRGTPWGIRLVRAFEQWAKRHNVAGVVLSDLVINGIPPLGDMPERLGYRLVERAHLKELI